LKQLTVNEVLIKNGISVPSNYAYGVFPENYRFLARRPPKIGDWLLAYSPERVVKVDAEYARKYSYLTFVIVQPINIDYGLEYEE